MNRFISAFVCLILSLTAAPLSLRSETAGTDAGASLPLSNFAVPEEIGKVRERFQGAPGRTIVQVQDVHAHAVAQQNIAAILERLRTVFSVEKAALEGAWSSTALPRSHALPTSREKQLLATTLLEDDRISGPVYAAIMSPDAISLTGIEDETFYEKNRTLFLTHLGKAEETEKKLQAYGASLQGAQRSTWAPDLLTFGSAFGKFRETSDLGKFFPILLKTAETQGAGTEDLTQITLLSDITTLEKSFTKERLEQEIKRVIKKYKNTPWTIEELIRGGKIPAEEIGLYPEIKKLTLLYRMRDELSLQGLTDQIGTLTGRILEKLVKTPEERALWERTERYYLAKRILLLQATPEDLVSYESEKSFLSPELTGAGLSEALALSIDFYDTVKKRDEIFFDKIMSDPALAGDLVVVTGGFHTDGLSKRFRDAGISYITVAPELGGTGMNEKLYNKRMEEGGGRRAENSKPETPSTIRHPSSESQTLSELRNAIAWVDERFPKALQVLFQTKDVRKAARVFEGDTVEVSKADKITRLAAENRLRRSGGPGSVDISSFRESEFMALARPDQREAVRRLIDQANSPEQKAMLVSSASVLRSMLSDTRSETRAREILARGDVLALVQDIPATQMPELFSTRGVERFMAPDIATLIGKTPRFQRIAKNLPFAIMKEGYQGGAYVVLPERSISLVLYRIVTLNDRLYQAAKNPEFLFLLEDLASEILSQELPKKAA
jgi:hypothetical protein